MQEERHAHSERYVKFFVTALSHRTLADYYNTVFELKEYGGTSGTKWHVDEIDYLFPYEVDVFIALTQKRVNERKEAASQQ